MKLIKLDAIDSTNEFLKGLSNQELLENFTVVTAENQTKGKGQMGATWSSETGKNLIMSILITDFLFDINAVYNLTIAISLAVIEALESESIPDLAIKWPNDIMAGNKKIGGILIENSIKSDGTIVSVAGLGLNVNQTNFENLPQASSLAVICNATFDKEKLLFKIIENIKQNIKNWNQNVPSLWTKYATKLFKSGVPMAFATPENVNFMGIIQGVSEIGKLQILLENDTIAEYDIKEIKMLY
jgi:BirA family transcriptional regulator, biotin operon repressor / biotin---[acetyl-CoA-carboxylase] ligase